MAITEKTVIDKIEVLDNGCLQVREANIVEKDGVVIAKTFHRYVIVPNSDISDKDQKIKDIAEAAWKNLA
jgi:hypothetical protein